MSGELLIVIVLLALLVAVLMGARAAGLLGTRGCLAVGIIAAAVVATTALGGCATAPKVPQQVIVTVERYKPLPAWATDPLPKPMPFDATVGARLHTNEARGGVIDIANCDRQLLKLLDAGTPVDPKVCGHE